MGIRNKIKEKFRNRSMKIYSVYNNKGGVGKTTSTINLSYVLSEMGYKILIIDADPQNNLSKAFQRSDDEGNLISCYDPEDYTIAELITNRCDIEDVIKHTRFENIDIITSEYRLSYTEMEIALEPNEVRLTKLRDRLESVKSQYDVCLIDCQPAFSSMTINALVASDEVLVPLEVGDDEIDGLAYLMRSMNDIKDQYNPKLNFKGCFLTRFVGNTSISKQMMDHLHNVLEDKVFKTVIRQNVSIKYARSNKLPVSLYDKNSNGSVDYKNLAKEIFS